MTFPDLSTITEFPGWRAARAARAVGPRPEREVLRQAYLELLKLCLCDLGGTSTASVGKWQDGTVTSRELRGENLRLRAAGMDWPLQGLTMVGLNRLDDLQACIESVVADGVEGDLIEAGAWRGGASILMRATLDSLGATERTVHVADSFQGFPVADELGDLNTADFLAVHVDDVKESFARFGLEHGVRIVPGFFEETMPGLAGGRWAVVRLDADTYEATRTALEALYPSVAVGGYLIVDDYGVMVREECRRAVDEFRAVYGISESLEEVDWTCVRWRRESDAPIEPAPRPRQSSARAKAAPRPRAPHVPTGREVELEREVAALRQQLSERSRRHRLVGRKR
jgi:O-methyltransferase